MEPWSPITLTRDQALMVANGLAKVVNNEFVRVATRTDSTSGDGLIKKVIVDPYSGSRYYEFSNAPGITKKLWMHQYMSPPRIMTRINKDFSEGYQLRNEKFKQQWLRDHNPDGSYTAEALENSISIKGLPSHFEG